MANTLKFGNGEWYGKKDTILAYNDENNNYKPLPFDFSRGSYATVVNKDGLIETVGSGEPRIDYKDDSKGALLLEPSRTNTAFPSENFSVFGSGSSTIVTNQSISPDGTMSADKIYPNSNGSYIGKYLNIGASTTGVVSCFVKQANKRYAILGTDNNATYSCIFDLQTGTVSSQATNYTAKIENYGNGWYRISAAYTSSAAAAYPFIGVADATNGSVTVDNTNGLFIWGFQYELNASYPTSYIPTQGGAVTRLVDDMPNHLNINPLNIGNSYTLFLDADLNKVVNNKVFCEIENSASNDVFSIRINNGGKVRVYNALDSAYPTSSLESNTNKWAIRIDGNSYKIFGANSSRSGTLATARNIGEIKFYGIFADLKINNFNIYNTPLSDAECESLVN